METIQHRRGWIYRTPPVWDTDHGRATREGFNPLPDDSGYNGEAIYFTIED